MAKPKPSQKSKPAARTKSASKNPPEDPASPVAPQTATPRRVGKHPGSTITCAPWSGASHISCQHCSPWLRVAARVILGTIPGRLPEPRKLVPMFKPLENAWPRTKPYKLTERDSLQLLITPKESKLRRFRYKFGGRENMMALGSFPDPTQQKRLDKVEAATAAKNTFGLVFNET